MKPLFIFAIMMVFLFLAAPKKAEGQKSGSDDSPTVAYKRLYSAVKRKNVEAIKSNMTQKSLDFGEMAAARQKIAPDEVFKNGFTATTFSETLPNIRNQRIAGTIGALEVWNSKDGKWEDLPFVFENGAWKIAIGEMFDGTFKEIFDGKFKSSGPALNYYVRAKSINMAFIKSTSVPIPTAGVVKTDPSKVKFLVKERCSRRYGFSGGGIRIDVMGIVAQDVRLSDDATAQQLLQMGIEFGRERCPSGGEYYDDGVLSRKQYDSFDKLWKRSISLSLYFGDPVTFSATDIPKFLDDRDDCCTAYDILLDKVTGYWADDNPTMVTYTNYPKALELSLAYEAQKKKEREAALEQQRQALQVRQNQIAARLAAFVKANKVKRIVTMSQLATNPFVYEGQVVAFDGIFDSMIARTGGIFVSWNGGQTVYVSGIPTSRFTQRRTMVILAGRVMGNIEVKLSGSGSTVLVPHVSFVGSAFCQESGCRDYGTP